MVAAADSSVAGYLAPIGAVPPDDAALDLLFQPVIVGITGLDPTLVRRKGQDVPAPQPSRATTWCAFATTVTQADTNPTLVHQGDADGGEGLSLNIRTETLEISVSFYGPAARGFAAMLRDGLGLDQNREAMRAEGLAYVAMDRITFVPDLQNGQFIRRADLVFRVRRMAIRTYAIRNILSIDGEVIAESGDASGPVVVTSPFEADLPS